MAKRGQFREIRRGLIVAAQLGFGEAFDTALESFASLPSMRGNAPLDDATLERFLLPLGEELGVLMQVSDTLQPLHALAAHPLAAVRCLAAGALPYMWENTGVMSTVERLSKDARPEVRTCLVYALLDLPGSGRWDLVARWLHADSPRQRSLALRILPHDPFREALTVISGCRADPDREVVEATVDALCRLAELDTKAMLKTLTTWSDSADAQTTRIIAQALARHPLVMHSAEVMEILELLAASAHDAQKRHAVEVALRAVARKAGTKDIRAALQAWTAASNPNRRTIAEHVLRRLDEPNE
jgi:hypothetical protein